MSTSTSTPPTEAAPVIEPSAEDRAVDRWGLPQVLGHVEEVTTLIEKTSALIDEGLVEDTPELRAKICERMGIPADADLPPVPPVPDRFPTESERLKRAKLIELLDVGLVSLGVWPFVDGVELPEPLKLRGQLILHVSRDLNHEVLELGPLALRVMLSFNRQPRLCVLPWECIWNMRNQEHDASGPVPSPCPTCGVPPQQLVFFPPEGEHGTPPRIQALGCANHGGVHTGAFFGAPSGLVCDVVEAWEVGRAGFAKPEEG